MLSCYSPTLSYSTTQGIQGVTYPSTFTFTTSSPTVPQYDTGMSYVPWQNTTSATNPYTAPPQTPQTQTAPPPTQAYTPYPPETPQTQTAPPPPPPTQGYTTYPPQTTPSPGYGAGGPAYATGGGAYPAGSDYTPSPANIVYDDVNPSQQLAQELCNITPEQWRTGQLGDLSNCLHNYTVDVFIKTEGVSLYV
ncbi:unnamed protein product [Cylicostephanus goldi]|uniref:Uncharacterized protein n=1 Tax=Cylicostephanus goldi TaxID=71465 RepID=A0A3P6RNG5_CYLGO|nr:unnamed protein product [Cylicostephanus goldi]